MLMLLFIHNDMIDASCFQNHTGVDLLMIDSIDLSLIASMMAIFDVTFIFSIFSINS